MRRALLLLLTPLCLVACPPGGGDGGTGGGGGTGGSGGSGGATGFDIQTLDATGGERRWISAAYDPAQNRIGVAYFVNLGTQTTNQIDYAIRYIEWKNGTVSAPETIVAKLQVAIGISLAFEPSGQPAVAYIGGGNEVNSLIWLQNDLMLARRSAAGTWTESTIAVSGAGYSCGNPVSDTPTQFVAGVWPSLTFDATGKGYLFWRNVHSGQYNVQDWQASDVILEELGPGGTVTARRCLIAGGNDKLAWGGRNTAVIAKGLPMVIGDHCDVNGPEAQGKDPYWVRLTDAGQWTAPRTAQGVSNTQTGASLAFDDLGPDGGTYGMAFVDKGADALRYIKSSDGEAWSFPDSVYASGSGGWYPSLAFDPINHEPAIAWYLCSIRSAVDESSCPATEDELRVTQKIVNTWRTVVVDNEGGFLPKLGFFPTGKRWVVYRSIGAGALKLAIEK